MDMDTDGGFSDDGGEEEPSPESVARRPTPVTGILRGGAAPATTASAGDTRPETPMEELYERLQAACERAREKKSPGEVSLDRSLSRSPGTLAADLAKVADFDLISVPSLDNTQSGPPREMSPDSVADSHEMDGTCTKGYGAARLQPGSVSIRPRANSSGIGMMIENEDETLVRSWSMSSSMDGTHTKFGGACHLLPLRHSNSMPLVNQLDLSSDGERGDVAPSPKKFRSPVGTSRKAPGGGAPPSPRTQPFHIDPPILGGAFIAPPSRGVAARDRAGSHDLDTPSHGGRRL